jgi:hypothetical protein
VIAVAYSDDIQMMPLLVAVLAFLLTLVMVRAGVRSGFVYLPVCLVVWGATLESGIDPVVSGLAIGLAAAAYTPGRNDLEQASDLFRSFREQPTPELARFARMGLLRSLSPNDRLTRTWSGVSSYLIVPLFGLANAGIVIDAGFLGDALDSRVTLGVFFAYVVGKPLAITGVSGLVTWLSRGRVRPAAGWASVLGTGTIAGMGFTVSFLIANLAFEEPELSDAKLGLLLAIPAASLITWTVFWVTGRLPRPRKAVALLGDVEELIDLIPDVDPERDHVRGPAEATVTLVEYGDFQCPYCGRAEPIVRELLTDDDLRYVWRHLPLTDVHPQAQLAAQAAEAAGLQGKFWEMHDLMFTQQDHLRIADLLRYAGELGLDQDKFHDDMMQTICKDRITADLESADLSGVSGTPTFFINGRRHYGSYDVQTLKEAIRVARVRAKIAAKRR